MARMYTKGRKEENLEKKRETQRDTRNLTTRNGRKKKPT